MDDLRKRAKELSEWNIEEDIYDELLTIRREAFLEAAERAETRQKEGSPKKTNKDPSWNAGYQAATQSLLYNLRKLAEEEK